MNQNQTLLSLSDELRMLHSLRPVGSTVTAEYHDRLANVVRMLRDMGNEEAVKPAAVVAPPAPRPVAPPVPAPTATPAPKPAE